MSATPAERSSSSRARRVKVVAVLFLLTWIAHLGGPILMGKGYLDTICRDTRFGWLCWQIERVPEGR